jgi:hypothetical protein
MNPGQQTSFADSGNSFLKLASIYMSMMHGIFAMSPLLKIVEPEAGRLSQTLVTSDADRV